MEKRIELEKRGRPSNQITDLNLDNCRSTNIVGLTDEFTALETLSLINVGLTTLKGFPKLPKLKKLELSDNRISSGLSNLTTSAPELTHLNLSGNKIKDLEELKPLENFKHLDSLDLFNNEATSMDSYREKIFALIPSLKFLDGYDAEEREAQSDGEDDDELNGNDSEDDGENCAFSINGIEIDLKELEIYEKRLAEKRQKHPITQSVANADTELDDLDDYLDKLNTAAAATASSSLQDATDTVSNNEQQPHHVGLECSDAETIQQASLPLLLYGVMSIIFVLSTVSRQNNI
ncbi:acidic leucine-rich nuclear phosphoprotein 32 family member A isoform X1 [Bradysia coprophila]|uniref:acidic leucine-rich nuclear phosphoprotein 32 family member A isoform X1 n=1 Tax=Bradysia coprophila TaxID=38358 RepID=UPI00187D8450|nr:acidic leucine-rich nuclear phosphoprotein 32 family member A isoform X1 [Bradysia coprophila]